MFSCHPVVGLLSLLLAGPTTGPAEDLADVSYKVDPHFPKLPADVKLGAVSGVATDAKGNLLVFHRADPPILVFDAKGQFQRSIGQASLFSSAHGLRVDAAGNLWVTDNANHTVLKLDASGKVLLTLGELNRRGVDEKHFNRPTDIAFAANGDVYVADGYGNARVVKFDKDGRYLKSWGKKGKADGEFNLPHAIQVDSKGQVYVGDRENNRIQVFDADGKFLRKIEDIAPFGLCITPDDILFVADGRANRVTKMTTDGKVLAVWGVTGTRPGQFDLAHGITVAADGVVYVSDINGKRVQKFVPAAH